MDKKEIALHFIHLDAQAQRKCSRLQCCKSRKSFHFLLLSDGNKCADHQCNQLESWYYDISDDAVTIGKLANSGFQRVHTESSGVEKWAF